MRDGFLKDGCRVLVTTSLGGATVWAESLHAQESISRPFEIRLSLGSADATIDGAALLGTAVHVSVEQTSGPARHFHGIVRAFTLIGFDAQEAHYEVELVPRLWLLSLERGRRIFQGHTAIEIVTAYAQRAGMTIRNEAEFASPAREYCVQYDETALEFVHRLLEQEGISYHFEHTSADHTMVLSDAPGSFSQTDGANPLVFRSLSGATSFHDSLLRFESRARLVTQAFAARDYQMQTPNTLNAAETAAMQGVGRAYFYPSRQENTQNSKLWLERLAQAADCDSRRFRGECLSPNLMPGVRFDVSEHPTPSLNAEYLVTEVHHSADNAGYRNHFLAIPGTQRHRPAAVTKPPRVIGSQTAIVVGPDGEDIHTDALGRIKIRFFWDEDQARAENSSCWVRVSQTWAGNGWGTLFIPRVGQEVVVTFIDGDPDRPLITGCVYNGENAPPASLPDQKTQTIIRSKPTKVPPTLAETLMAAGQLAIDDSPEAAAAFMFSAAEAALLGGERTEGNEIKLEDKEEEELFYIHAQKDLQVDVEDSSTTTIYEGDETRTIEKGNLTVAIQEGGETRTIAANRSTEIGGNDLLAIAGNLTQTVKGNYSLTVDGNLSITVKGTLQINSTGAMTLDSKAAATVKSAATLSLEGLSLNGKGSSGGTIDGGSMLTLKGGMVKIN
jgi:type VI secretion system secreted protein VgrG